MLSWRETFVMLVNTRPVSWLVDMFRNSSVVGVELVKDKASPFHANGLKLYLIPLYSLEQLSG